MDPVSLGDEVPELVDEEPESDPDDQPVGEVIDDGEVERLRAALEEEQAKRAAAEAELAEKSAKLDGLNPTVDVSPWLWETRDDVVAFYGMDKLREIVEGRIATENKRRTKDGYDRLQYTREEKEAMVDEVIDELLEDRQRTAPPEEGPLARTLKMVAFDPQTNEPRLVQIPYEEQVNNIAGSLADGIVRYTNKGYKRTNPPLCPAQDCFRPSAMEGGQFLHYGYCSEDHRARTEPRKPEQVVA
ncbi:MAG TPA: hypothetical protein VF377_06890 [Acidimicrobiia bacterium]